MAEKDKQAQIEALLAEADAKLEEARQLADDAEIYVSWSGPTYGMGGWIESGEWQASSYSC